MMLDQEGELKEMYSFVNHQDIMTPSSALKGLLDRLT